MHENKNNHWLYILKLEQGKFYVGITTKTPEYRFKQHKNRFIAAAWTKKYRPIIIYDKKYLGKISRDEAILFENKVVRKYIKKYGINNVRGGDLTFTENAVVLLGTIYITEKLKDLLQFLLFVMLIIVAFILLI